MDYLTKITCDRPKPSSVKTHRNLVEETESDRGRIIQSAAIRRLQQKTQVYPLETNAAVRSRLTHSLEVQQTGRYLSRTILAKFQAADALEIHGLASIETAFTNLVEMACLMHDVGNPPFGHFGEETISCWMAEHAAECHRKSLKGKDGHTSLFRETLLPDLCVFEGNAQGLRIIHTLQELNLTYSQIAALMKYTRPPYQPRPGKHQPFHYHQKKPGFYYSEEPLVRQLWQSLNIAEGCRFPLVYIMEAADDIAYCIADLEDAVDKGILSFRELQYRLKEVWQEFSGNDNTYLLDIIKEARSDAGSQTFIIRLRTRLVRDLVDYASSRYLENHQAIYNGTLDEPLIDGGSSQHLALKTLKTVAIRHIFNNREKETPELRGYSALTGLMNIYRPLLELPRKQFEAIAYQDDGGLFIQQRLYHRLSRKYKAAYCSAVQQAEQTVTSENLNNDLEWYYRARLIIDYISGMTDHFVVAEFQSLSAI
ncbi:dGTPase [Endozoicomonas sp. Mp262]|uniref:dGTPase n=1 Tax=Endozoicomonas sp. Mp262 TaxID=2919499 RepID=UPI0021D93D66